MLDALINNSTLSSIADAIREKNGGEETYLPSEMPDAILALEASSSTVGEWPDYDEDAACYDNASVEAWLDYHADGKSYGVSIPKTETVDCTKTGDNAGISAPTPGTSSSAAVDPYDGLGPFRAYECNGYVDSDGTPHVTAISGDDRGFARDGTNGNVWVMAPVLWWSYDETSDDACELVVSDTALDGLSAQPAATLPSGEQRPYVLYAKYPMGSYNGGYASVSGVTPTGGMGDGTNISYSGVISMLSGTSYHGKNLADDWYVKVMFLLKYATKNSQSVFYGNAQGGMVSATGDTDSIEGLDGSVDATGGSSPFKLQGIELMHGLYEQLNGCFLYDNGDGVHVYAVRDGDLDAAEVTADFEDLGQVSDSSFYDYALYPTNCGGLLMGTSSGGSTTTGLCDYQMYYGWPSPIWSLGYCDDGSVAGLWCVWGLDGLASDDGIVGARLSANGRSG